jgi:hypothetical protein
LTRPAFAGPHPNGLPEIAAVCVGFLGAVVVVLASAYLLHPRRLAFSINARATLEAIEANDPQILEDDDLFHETMILTFTQRREGNQPIVDRLQNAFSISLIGLLLELAGLGAAVALAS